MLLAVALIAVCLLPVLAVLGAGFACETSDAGAVVFTGSGEELMSLMTSSARQERA